jgi:hypothetical protein
MAEAPSREPVNKILWFSFKAFKAGLFSPALRLRFCPVGVFGLETKSDRTEAS